MLQNTVWNLLAGGGEAGAAAAGVAGLGFFGFPMLGCPLCSVLYAVTGKGVESGWKSQANQPCQKTQGGERRRYLRALSPPPIRGAGAQPPSNTRLAAVSHTPH